MNLATLSSFDTASNGPFFLYLIDKTLLLTARSIGGLFSRVKRYSASGYLRVFVWCQRLVRLCLLYHVPILERCFLL